MPYVPLGVTQQGRMVPTKLREANLDARQQERTNADMPLGDLLLSTGAVEGPFKRAKTITRWAAAARRFTRQVLAMLLAPCN